MENPDEDFMIGNAIKVTPVLEKSATEVSTYFPNTYWVDLNTYEVTASYDADKTEGSTVKLPTTWDYVHMHIAAGHIVPMHNVTKDDIDSTTQLVSFATT